MERFKDHWTCFSFIFGGTWNYFLTIVVTYTSKLKYQIEWNSASIETFGANNKRCKKWLLPFICWFHCPHGSFGLHKVHWTHLTGHQQHPLSQNRWQSSQNRLAISNSNKFHLTFVPLIISSIFVTLPDVVMWGSLVRQAWYKSTNNSRILKISSEGNSGMLGGCFDQRVRFGWLDPCEV